MRFAENRLPCLLFAASFWVACAGRTSTESPGAHEPDGDAPGSHDTTGVDPSGADVNSQDDNTEPGPGNTNGGGGDNGAGQGNGSTDGGESTGGGGTGGGDSPGTPPDFDPTDRQCNADTDCRNDQSCYAGACMAEIGHFRFGGPHDEWGQAIAIDREGNVLAAAFLEEETGFQAQRRNLLLTKLDPGGEIVWTRTIQGGGLRDRYIPTAVAVDSANAVYLVGETSQTDPNDRIAEATPDYNTNGFIVKYSSTGDRVGFQFWDEEREMSVADVAVDDDDHIYVLAQINRNPRHTILRKYAAGFDGRGEPAYETNLVANGMTYYLNSLTVRGNRIYAGGQRGDNAVVVVLDADSGTEITRQLMVASNRSVITDVAADDDGLIVVSGYTQGAFDQYWNDPYLCEGLNNCGKDLFFASIVVADVGSTTVAAPQWLTQWDFRAADELSTGIALGADGKAYGAGLVAYSDTGLSADSVVFELFQNARWQPMEGQVFSGTAEPWLTDASHGVTLGDYYVDTAADPPELHYCNSGVTDHGEAFLRWFPDDPRVLANVSPRFVLHIGQTPPDEHVAANKDDFYWDVSENRMYRLQHHRQRALWFTALELDPEESFEGVADVAVGPDGYLYAIGYTTDSTIHGSDTSDTQFKLDILLTKIKL